MANRTNYERETIIVFNEAEKIAYVSTYNSRFKRRIQDIAERFPVDVKLNVQDDDYIDCEMPKSMIKINPPKQLSDDARKAISERASRMASERFNNGTTNDSSN